MYFKQNFRVLKRSSSNPENPDLGFWRSTVHRPSNRPMCTGHAHSSGLRAGRSGGRPIQRVYSLDLAPVDRAVDQPREQCSLVHALIDRAVDRQVKTWVRSTGRSTDNPHGLKNDHWPVNRPVDRQAIWPPTTSFLQPINWGVLG